MQSNMVNQELLKQADDHFTSTLPEKVLKHWQYRSKFTKYIIKSELSIEKGDGWTRCYQDCQRFMDKNGRKKRYKYFEGFVIFNDCNVSEHGFVYDSKKKRVIELTFTGKPPRVPMVYVGVAIPQFAAGKVFRPLPDSDWGARGTT